MEEGTIGKADRIVNVFSARDMVVTIGDRVLPLKENETLQVFEGTERPRERIIRSETFALGTSNRVAVMHEGSVTGILDRNQCTEEAIMRLAVG